MKKALVVSGGGMKCAYSAGAIYYLANKGYLDDFKIFIGGSGGTGTLSYFCSKQYKSIYNIWRNLLHTNKFVNHLRLKKLIDIDYLIDEVFKKQDTLNEKEIHKFKKLYLVSVTNYHTGKVEHISNKQNVDFFEAMRASMAMPLVYNKVIKIKNKHFCDTPNSNFTELNILKAIELGAEEILVIDNDSLDYLSEIGFNTWLFSMNKKFKKNYNFEKEKREKLKITRDVKLIYLRPSKKLNIKILENNKRKLRKTFKRGVKDAKRFLKQTNQTKSYIRSIISSLINKKNI